MLQATQSYLKSAGIVPSPRILLQPNTTWKSKKRFDSSHTISCLGPRELFILYVAAIGHDVGHPGFSNIFMVRYKLDFPLRIGIDIKRLTPSEKRQNSVIASLRQHFCTRKPALCTSLASDEASRSYHLIRRSSAWAASSETLAKVCSRHGYGCSQGFHGTDAAGRRRRVRAPLLPPNHHLPGNPQKCGYQQPGMFMYSILIPLSF